MCTVVFNLVVFLVNWLLSCMEKMSDTLTTRPLRPANLCRKNLCKVICKVSVTFFLISLHFGCEWVSVSSGTGLPGLSLTSR